MRVVRSTILAAPAVHVFDLLTRGDTIARLTEGFPISYRDAELPLHWQEGEPVNLKPRFFGISQGDHFVTFTRIDQSELLLYTEEYGTGIKRWDHSMELKPLRADRCIYTDTVRIEAGLRTPIVGLIARLLYRHRHQRLHTLLTTG